MNGQENEIMALAKKAGLLDKVNSWDVWFPDNLEVFAKLVAAKEREACALVSEDCGAIHVAKRIRARGEA
jgi:hypothetical protein